MILHLEYVILINLT